MASKTAHHIALEGDLGLRDATRLSEQFRDAIAKHSEVVMTSKGLTGIDISVLQLLVSARKTALAAGKSLTLEAPPGGALRNILVKAGFLAADGTALAADGDFWTSTRPEREHASMTKTILTIDDSASIRQMVVMTLASAGHTVIEAINGADGYDKATANTVHAVITDLNMPVLNGIEFIRKYRQHPVQQGRADHPADHRVRRGTQAPGQGSRRHRLDRQAVQAGPAAGRHQEGHRRMSFPDPTETFRQEARELLEQLEQGLLDLEQNPANDDLINSTFRALHTIKGSGAMFGFTAVASFVHEFETAFDQVRKGQTVATPALIEVALDAKDHIHKLIEQPDAEMAGGDAILAALRAVIDRQLRPQRHAGSRDRRRRRPGGRAGRGRRRRRAGASASACPAMRWSMAPIRCCCSTRSPPSAPARSRR